MGWIDTILSLLGRTSDGNRETGDAEITVEKEPAATTERAVKEPVESEQAAEEPDEQTEDGEETGKAEAEEAVDAKAEAKAEGAVEAKDDVKATQSDPGAGASVTTIKGIGDAYTDRLAAGGVESVDALADADAEALSDDTGISEKRIQRWIDRAREK